MRLLAESRAIVVARAEASVAVALELPQTRVRALPKRSVIASRRPRPVPSNVRVLWSVLRTTYLPLANAIVSECPDSAVQVDPIRPNGTRPPSVSCQTMKPDATLERSRYWVRLLDQPTPNCPALLESALLYVIDSD